MGCDIHIVLEKKNDHGKWVGLFEMGSLPRGPIEHRFYQRGGGKIDQTPPDYSMYRIRERDYEFFTALAGVRGEEGEGEAPRGLPDDASDLSLMNFEHDPDMHTPSWHGLRELIPILAMCKEGKTITDAVADKLLDITDGDMKIVAKYIDEYIEPEQIDDYRIVYAFDN